MKKINKNMTIAETVQQFPETADILMGFGMHCLGCPAASAETLEEASMVHQIDLELLLEELNK